MVVYGSTTVGVLYTVYRDVLLLVHYYCYTTSTVMQYSNAIASTRVTTDTLLAIDARARVDAIDRSTAAPQDRGYSRSILCGGIW